MGIISLSLSIVGFLMTVLTLANYDMIILILTLTILMAAIVTGIISINLKSYRTPGLLGLVIGSVVCIPILFFVLIPIASIVNFFTWTLPIID